MPAAASATAAAGLFIDVNCPLWRNRSIELDSSSVAATYLISFPSCLRCSDVTVYRSVPYLIPYTSALITCKMADNCSSH